MHLPDARYDSAAAYTPRQTKGAKFQQSEKEVRSTRRRGGATVAFSPGIPTPVCGKAGGSETPGIGCDGRTLDALRPNGADARNVRCADDITPTTRGQADQELL